MFKSCIISLFSCCSQNKFEKSLQNQNDKLDFHFNWITQCTKKAYRNSLTFSKMHLFAFWWSRLEDQYHFLLSEYKSTANSRLAYLSIKTGNRGKQQVWLCRRVKHLITSTFKAQHAFCVICAKFKKMTICCFSLIITSYLQCNVLHGLCTTGVWLLSVWISPSHCTFIFN